MPSDDSPAPDLAAWVGRAELARDVAGAERVAGLAALLDHDVCPWLPGLLPPLAHWLLFHPTTPQSKLGRDGHARRDAASLLPPVPQPRRMWAGSRVDFLADVPLGTALERRSTVTAVAPKTGASGTMVFVTVRHEIAEAGRPVIVEEQDIVYRGETGAAPPAPADTTPATSIRAYTGDPVALFRYSALTFNGHRIHYDHDYARDVEGYPGLVVHGPLIATLLLDTWLRAHPRARVRRFAFRARRPIFDGVPFELCVAGDALWARERDGPMAMTATVEAG